MLNGQTIASGDDVVITDIGERDGAGNPVICMTDVVKCCNESGERQGEWAYPNKSVVGRPKENQGFYRNRGQQQIFLNRRNNTIEPLGLYCCEVNTTNEANATICINMSKQ